MDATRSSLEFPPPAWSCPTGSVRRPGTRRDGLVLVWMLASCAVVGLVLLVAISPALQAAPATAGIAAAITGWGALSARLLRLRRRHGSRVGVGR